MTHIALLDYGMGNLHSVAKALEYVGASVSITNDPKIIRRADKLVFPGVGGMRDCMQGMREAGIDAVVTETIFNKPLLAICVGMQALMEYSEENQQTKALALLSGSVRHLPTAEQIKVPHMGWNTVHQIHPSHPLWKNIDQNTRFYFVHSYYVAPQEDDLIAATCDYAVPFCAALQKENLFATQFHPEKSDKAGLQLLKNFVEWTI